MLKVKDVYKKVQKEVTCNLRKVLKESFKSIKKVLKVLESVRKSPPADKPHHAETNHPTLNVHFYTCNVHTTNIHFFTYYKYHGNVFLTCCS